MPPLALSETMPSLDGPTCLDHLQVLWTQPLVSLSLLSFTFTLLLSFSITQTHSLSLLISPCDDRFISMLDRTRWRSDDLLLCWVQCELHLLRYPHPIPSHHMTLNSWWNHPYPVSTRQIWWSSPLLYIGVFHDISLFHKVNNITGPKVRIVALIKMSLRLVSFN